MRGAARWAGSLTVLLLCVMLPRAASARLPDAAPPLPTPGASGERVIRVDTAQALAEACWNLASDQTIVIAAGTYDLASVTFPNGVDGRLTVGRYGATPIARVQLRGETGDPRDVVLRGAGPLDPVVPFGVQVFTATDVVIADLSIEAVYYHAVQIAGEQGAARVRLHHLRLSDAGQQIVKGTGDPDDVEIAYSEVFHTAGADHHPDGPGGGCYTNGIDSTGGARWWIHDNLVHGIYCQDDTLAGPAILLWQGMSDSVVERNTILDSSRGISLGLNAGDHTGGVVRNNFIVMDPSASYARDVGIYSVSPASVIAHNTVLLQGAYPNAIEVRFGTTTGVRVEQNLLDGAIQDRAGASSLRQGNVSVTGLGSFADVAAGDLHLLATASEAIDRGDPITEVSDDFDGEPRPGATGAVDVGADERGCSGCADGGVSDAGAGPDGGDAGEATDGGDAGDAGPWIDAGSSGDGGDAIDGGSVDGGGNGSGGGCACDARGAPRPGRGFAALLGCLSLLVLLRRRS